MDKNGNYDEIFGFNRKIRVNFQSEIKNTSCGNFLNFWRKRQCINFCIRYCLRLFEFRKNFYSTTNILAFAAYRFIFLLPIHFIGRQRLFWRAQTLFKIHQAYFFLPKELTFLKKGTLWNAEARFKSS